MEIQIKFAANNKIQLLDTTAQATGKNLPTFASFIE